MSFDRTTLRSEQGDVWRSNDGHIFIKFGLKLIAGEEKNEKNSRFVHKKP